MNPPNRIRTVPPLRFNPASRGYVVAWTCWGRPDMIPLIMDAWKANYRPDDATLLFLFDSPEDDGVAKYWERRVCSMAEYAFMEPYIVHGPDVHENALHREAIHRWYIRTWSHTLIVWQDDQVPVGNRLLDDVDRLRASYNYNRLGVVGGRDGFDPGYANMAGSPHSTSSNITHRLAIGEFQTRPLINRGPVVYPRHVVGEIGAVDSNTYPTWYGEMDYAARSHEAGYINGVLGVDCVHEVRGRVTASWHYDGDESARQLATFRARHPGCCV